MGLTENRERPAFFWKLETRNWQPMTKVAAKSFFVIAAAAIAANPVTLRNLHPSLS
ncbi:MAG: hypothetical protein K8L97_16275 [Anaerolineae bacterium]|nr:hypothetical protein [Anaerolineae bacterium]